MWEVIFKARPFPFKDVWVVIVECNLLYNFYRVHKYLHIHLQLRKLVPKSAGVYVMSSIRSRWWKRRSFTSSMRPQILFVSTYSGTCIKQTKDFIYPRKSKIHKKRTSIQGNLVIAKTFCQSPSLECNKRRLQTGRSTK